MPVSRLFWLADSCLLTVSSFTERRDGEGDRQTEWEVGNEVLCSLTLRTLTLSHEKISLVTSFKLRHLHRGHCSVTQSCPTLCNPMNGSMPGFPVYHQLPELAQTHVHPIGDAIQPSHPLSSPSPPAFNLSQHQGLFQWVSCLH